MRINAVHRHGERNGAGVPRGHARVAVRVLGPDGRRPPALYRRLEHLHHFEQPVRVLVRRQRRGDPRRAGLLESVTDVRCRRPSLLLRRPARLGPVYVRRRAGLHNGRALGARRRLHLREDPQGRQYGRQLRPIRRQRPSSGIRRRIQALLRRRMDRRRGRRDPHSP